MHIGSRYAMSVHMHKCPLLDTGLSAGAPPHMVLRIPHPPATIFRSSSDQWTGGTWSPLQNKSAPTAIGSTTDTNPLGYVNYFDCPTDVLVSFKKTPRIAISIAQ